MNSSTFIHDEQVAERLLGHNVDPNSNEPPADLEIEGSSGKCASAVSN